MQDTSFEFNIGPFNVNLTTDCLNVATNIKRLYQDFEEVSLERDFVDFFVSVKHVPGLRRWLKPQINFYFDEQCAFNPLPVNQAYPVFEWGLNWCIAKHAHHFLILHAAAVEKNEQVLIMPAPPGSGKSTLCAALVYNGWRLFSDELALLSVADSLFYPCARPINLKNESIFVLQDYLNHGVFSSISEHTKKGTVALLKPPKKSVEMNRVPAKAGAVVFPRYQSASPAKLTPVDTITGFSRLIENSFNYHTLGSTGFHSVGTMLRDIKCYDLEYSEFEETNRILSELIS